ncbi:flavin reductase family protein [Pseudooceanicola onchidii]|uniref:flavin reductase family protein n=1 Tax=Pseudooceanicola onchidii TaxID=2562279 RepID=UPI0010AB4961|nr:flavin reductase family protein [Pseudooceanicola onchidii]
MHYGSDRPEILKHDPFKAIVAPRPIGWIGTLNADGVPNLGPYSFFMPLGSAPHMIAFTSEGMKHSPANAKAQGEFTFSLATDALKHAMNVSSGSHPDGANEFELAGLTLGVSQVVGAPFVAESPAALECRTISVQPLVDIEGNTIDRYLVIGQVVQTHIRDEYIRDGRFDTAAAAPLARLGYRDYATADTLWELTRPDD